MDECSDYIDYKRYVRRNKDTNSEAHQRYLRKKYSEQTIRKLRRKTYA